MGISTTLSKLGQSHHYTFNSDFADYADVVEHGSEDLSNYSVDSDPYLIKTTADRFVDAEGWNNFKNAEVTGDDTEAVALLESYLDQGYSYLVAYYMMVGELGTETIVVNNFVQCDADFSDYIRDVDLNILNCKRANVMTGSGDDSIYVSVLSNSGAWDNDFYIDVGEGADVLVFDLGNADEANNDEFDFVNNGSLSVVYLDLGDDNDTDSLQIFTVQDFELINFDVNRDKIDVQGAALESVVANVATFSLGDETFTITADVETLEGYFFDGVA